MGSSWVNQSQLELSWIQWSQEGPKSVKWGQVRVKWGLVVRGLVSGWVNGWAIVSVSEMFGGREVGVKTWKRLIAEMLGKSISKINW